MKGLIFFTTSFDYLPLFLFSWSCFICWRRGL